MSKNFSIPLPSEAVFVPVAVKILAAALVPILYRDLAVATFERLAWPHPRVAGGIDNMVHFREKVRQAAKRGVGGLAYGGASARSYVFLRDWFDRSARLLNVSKPHVVRVGAADLAAAFREVARRAQYIENKADRGPYENADHLLRTFAAQLTVYRYFREHWPDVILPPSNDADATCPAVDDFSVLKIRGAKRRYTVDVSTRYASGIFGGHQKTVAGQRAAVHVLCDVETDAAGVIAAVSMIGWCTNAELARGVAGVEDARDIRRIFVALRCAQEGIDVDDLRAASEMSQEDRNRALGRIGKRLPTPARRQVDGGRLFTS